MRTSYGVVWREGTHPLARGKLELLPRTMRLEGMMGSEPATREIAYDHLAEIRIGRSAEERIDGRASLLLAPLTGETVSIASVAQAGVVAEIAERLARSSSAPHAARPKTAIVSTDDGRSRHERGRPDAQSRSRIRHRGSEGPAREDRRLRGCPSSPGLELGVYVLVAPEPDRQQPHEDDEVYVVLEGQGVLDVEGTKVELREGHALFVPAGAEHRFSGYEELSLLVIFERTPASR